MVKMLSPRDYGDVFGFYAAISIMSHFLMFSFNYWQCVIIAQINMVYTLIFVNRFVYGTELKPSIMMCVNFTLFL